MELQNFHRAKNNAFAFMDRASQITASMRKQFFAIDRYYLIVEHDLADVLTSLHIDNIARQKPWVNKFILDKIVLCSI